MEVPDAQLSEYANEIHSRYNVQVSKSRVSTILKNLGYLTQKGIFSGGFSNCSWQRRQLKGPQSFEILGFANYIYEGAVNAETYTAFIEERLLPHCTPFPDPRSIIVMDNASIYRSEVPCFYF